MLTQIWGKNKANLKLLEETYYFLYWALTKLGSIYSKTKAFIANMNKLHICLPKLT